MGLEGREEGEPNSLINKLANLRHLSKRPFLARATPTLRELLHLFTTPFKAAQAAGKIYSRTLQGLNSWQLAA